MEHRPQVPAQDRVKAHRRLVQHQQVRIAKQGHGKVGPSELTARERADQTAFEAAQIEGGHGPRDRIGQA